MMQPTIVKRSASIMWCGILAVSRASVQQHSRARLTSSIVIISTTYTTDSTHAARHPSMFARSWSVMKPQLLGNKRYL